MCRLFETLQLKDGRFRNPHAHERRMNASRKALLGLSAPLSLDRLPVPDDCRQGVYRCKVVYRTEIEEITISPYMPKSLQRVKAAVAEDLDYSHKWLDRSALDRLLTANPGFDEVFIIQKGLFTDATYANLAFFDGRDWFTPARPLLEGTRRAELLSSWLLKTRDIRPGDLHKYPLLSLINALLDLGELVIPSDQIFI